MQDLMAPEHQNDTLGVVPLPLRGMVHSSLWDSFGAGTGGGGGDSISMKQQLASADQVKTLCLDRVHVNFSFEMYQS